MFKLMTASFILSALGSANSFAATAQSELSIKIENALHSEAKNIRSRGQQGRAVMFVRAQESLKAMMGLGGGDIDPMEFSVRDIAPHRKQFEGISTLHTIHGFICVDIELRVVGTLIDGGSKDSYSVETVTFTPKEEQHCV